MAEQDIEQIYLVIFGDLLNHLTSSRIPRRRLWENHFDDASFGLEDEGVSFKQSPAEPHLTPDFVTCSDTLRYQWAHPEVGRLVYCTRTVPEMSKALEELRKADRT